MFKLVWTPARALPPDDPAYADGLDQLATTGHSQDLRRGDAAVPGLDAPLAADLDAWLARRADPGGPVALMVHGFLFDPKNDGSADDPFELIYGYPNAHLNAALSFLPIVGECDEDGRNRSETAIAFAWTSMGSFIDRARACWDNGYKYAALDLAPRAARALASVLARLAAKGVDVRILAHSLGTRTTTQAVRLLKAQGLPTSIGRMVLLGGAEFSVDAADAYDPLGFDVFNLGSRMDRVLRFGADTGCHPVRHTGATESRVLGRSGLGAAAPWLDVRLDSRDVAQWFAMGSAPTGLVYRVRADAGPGEPHPQGSLDHWIYYTDPQNRRLVHDLLFDPRMTVAACRAAGLPAGFGTPGDGPFHGMPIPATPQTCQARLPQTASNPAHRTDFG